jgi:hypothetical protein
MSINPQAREASANTDKNAVIRTLFIFFSFDSCSDDPRWSFDFVSSSAADRQIVRIATLPG